MQDSTGITALLSAARHGDSAAESQLFSALYRDLRRLAHQRLRRSKHFTLLETTALVHEAYLRLNQAGYLEFSDRAHFLAYAARVMRSIVVDLVRKRGIPRHDAVDANDVVDPASLAGENEILGVDEALQQLAQISTRMVQVVEMRYFAGMKETEIAEALSLTERTVRRDWEKARMLLATSLRACSQPTRGDGR
jgi:RNA polymerase sigma factor (TIGR02999 family)